MMMMINFCCNRKRIYNFLLATNCHISSISHRFRDTESRIRQLPRSTLSHGSRSTVWILSTNLADKELWHRVTLHYLIFSRFVTLALQTDDRRHIMTIANKRAVIKYLFKQISNICLNRYLITAHLLFICMYIMSSRPQKCILQPTNQMRSQADVSLLLRILHR